MHLHSAEPKKHVSPSSGVRAVKHSIRITLPAAIILPGAMDALTIEDASHKVLEKDNGFEIRDCAPNILAETVVEGDLEETGDKACL
jgi:hypothetical protein